MDGRGHIRLATLKKEREDFGAIVKIKRTCLPEVQRYLARLRLRRQNITEQIDHVDPMSKKARCDIARIKAERKLLDKLIQEFDQADDIYNQAGKEIADIQEEIKKETRRKTKTYKTVPPKE